jgi:hypothetical protein
MKFVRIGSILATVVLWLGAQPGQAQTVVPLPNQTLPSYAQPSSEQTIKGRISAVNNPFNISVRDDNGYIDNVLLHRGTIINPTGLTLAVGMRVTILGYNAGDHFDANEIDTPYTYGGPFPAPVYYGPGWWYPGYVYGYGPAFGLFIVGGGVVSRPFPHQYPIAHPPYPRPYVNRPYVGHPPIARPSVPGRRSPAR